MESIELDIVQWAFPSKGRARLHESLLGKLDLKEGDEVELTTGKATKPVVVTVFADALVEEGYIRLRTEDIARLWTAPGTMVTVKKRPAFGDRMKKGAGDTAESVKTGAAQAPGAIKEGAHKASEGIKSGLPRRKYPSRKEQSPSQRRSNPRRAKKKSETGEESE